MAIIVHSPHDGQPVKVRDQDLERAIRDSEGRIFYAVKRSDGQGYYGALTRKGSDKDEQRHLEMLEKMKTARDIGKVRSDAQVHDATGKKAGPGVLAWVLLLIVAILIAAITWHFVKPDNANVLPTPAPQPPAEAPGAGATLDALIDHEIELALDAQGYVGTSSGLRYKILEPGVGEPAVAGRYVQVQYVASTLKGELFDQTDPDRPAGFVMWSGRVPRGWDEGVSGMRVGEKRRLILTPEMMCGPYPGDVVLPDGVLVFDMELMGVLPGVRYTKVAEGDGAIAGPGDVVRVHYLAYLGRDRACYDSTYDRGEPVELRIGTGEVIQGWELGVAGMVEGEKRAIEIPPYLGYGPRGAAGVIPPGASLRYTVELVRVVGPANRVADAGRDAWADLSHWP
jgi:FKBP-type peptidyl-prolyl cis-trans isomerase